MSLNIEKLNKSQKTITLFIVDYVLLFAIFFFFIHANGMHVYNNLLNNLMVYITFKIVIFYIFGLYKFLWRYASVKSLVCIINGVTVSVFLTFLYNLYAKFLPNSFFIIDWAFTLILIGGFRFSLRIYRDYLINKFPMNENAEENIKRLIIIGAGDAGEIIAREIQKSKKLNYKIIGFVDDKPSKKGTAIHNIPILGSINELSRIQERYLIDEAIIAIPSATGKELRKIVEQCNSANITYKVTPGLFEIIDGQVSINQIREVRIEDLLGREIVNSNLISSSDIKNKVVLVTGAAGSIGSELCRQIIRYSPDTLILLDNCEYGMYMIDMEIRKTMLKSQSPVSVKIDQPSVAIRSIVLEGEVRYPGVYSAVPGERISDVILRAGGFTDTAFPGGMIYTRVNVLAKQKVGYNRSVEEEQKRLIYDQSRYVTFDDQDHTDSYQNALKFLQFKEKEASGRIIIEYSNWTSFIGSQYDLVVEDGDRLSIPHRPSSVPIIGGVNQPSAVTFVSGKPATFYIDRVGGRSEFAKKNEVLIFRANGSVAKSGNVELGDVVYVPEEIKIRTNWVRLMTNVTQILTNFVLALAVVGTFK